MLKKLFNVLKYILPAVLAFILMYFAFRNVDFQEFWKKTQQVDFIWVFISIALSYFSYVIRAYRWNLLLEPLGFSHLTTNRTTVAVLIGYLANLAFPRLGEVTRCGILKRNEGVPMTISFGSVITERIIDVVTLFALMLLTLVIEYDTLIAFLKVTMSGVQNISGLAWKAALTLLLLAVVFGVVIYIGIRSGGKFKAFIRKLLEGLLSLRKVRNFPAFIFSTLLLWVVYYYMSYIIIFSLPETSHLNWQAGIMLLVTSGIALSIPVQGGFGTYHTLIGSMLLLYGIDKTTGVFFATLLHTSQLIAIAVFGGTAVVISLFLKKRNEPNEA